MIIPVILSGGSGTRLWPLSRQAQPKQFLSLSGEESFFQSSASRLAQMNIDAADPLIICNEEHRFLVAEQLREKNIHPMTIMLESEVRNTAPALACAALYVQAHHPDSVMMVMPSDHILSPSEVFKSSLLSGQNAAENGYLVTFGITPDRPETGYGYIRRSSDLIAPSDTSSYYQVAQFVEKPDLETATYYLDSGEYFWNSGMFMFRADVYLDELQKFNPDILQCTQRAYQDSKEDMDFLRLGQEAFANCPSESIDYAIMEKTDRAAMVPLESDWNDIGSWSALFGIEEQDEHGNVRLGDTLTVDVEDSYLRSEHRLVAGIGLKNHIVVETADAVLVAERSRVQDVKAIVAHLKSAGRCEHQHHVTVYRPWGSYETITEAPGFKVKRIIVNPGAFLSLQLHHHRAEHWVVVRGTAQIVCGEKETTLEHDQSVYIPAETKHRLGNTGTEPLEIIEVQTGGYLEEDDIVRFVDIYGR